MFKNVTAAGVLIASLAATPMVAQATDGTISFTGSLSNSTCTINGGTGSFSVALPVVSISSLGSAAATAGATPFSIKMTGCTGTSTSTTTYFESGAAINYANGRLKNTAATTPATNVEIELLNADNSVIDLSKAVGAQGVAAAPMSASSSTANFVARYYASAATTAGAVASTVNYSITYN
jgi:major type 1 subunit fimbrin (pilin)